MLPNTRRPAGFLKRLTYNSNSAHKQKGRARARARDRGARTAAAQQQQAAAKHSTELSARAAAADSRRPRQRTAAAGIAPEEREDRHPSGARRVGEKKTKATSTKCELDEVKRNGGLERTGVAERWSPKISQNWTVVEKPVSYTHLTLPTKRIV